MSYIINPKSYGLESHGRLLYYDIKKKKYINRQIIKNGEIIEISNSGILRNPLNFKFRFQKMERNKWINISEFFFLEKARYVRQFFIDSYHMSDDEIVNMLEVFSKDKANNNYEIAKIAFNKAVSYINSQELEKIVNIRRYLNIVKQSNCNLTPLWKNINVYLEYILRRKELFIKYDIQKKSYPEIIKKYNENLALKNAIQNEIKQLSEYDLEFANILKGLYYSFIADRYNAEKIFSQTLNGDKKLINDFNIARGISTYLSEVSINNNYKNDVEFIHTNNVKRDLTIILSVDVNFLRKYGPQLFYSIIALKKYYFHFHVVGSYKEVIETVTLARELFKNMLSFFDSSEQVIDPSFSTEECPEYVSDPVTLYACARFLHAEKFMNYFGSKLLLIDADFYINNDFGKFIKEIENFDICMSIVSGPKALHPWTRFMAGNVFLNQNDNSKKFLKVLNAYINANLRRENTWTLDQNALTYAYETINKECKDFSVGNAYKFSRPLVQPPIRRYIED